MGRCGSGSDPCVCLLLQLVAQGQFRILKVPLGFIKVLQWVSSPEPVLMGFCWGSDRVLCLLLSPQFFAIFAFSTCGSYSGMFKMAVECRNRTESDLAIQVEFEYPFRSGHFFPFTTAEPNGPGRTSRR